MSVIDEDWVEIQTKDTQCKFIKEAQEKKWMYKFPMPNWYKKSEKFAKDAVIRNSILWIRKTANWCYMFHTYTGMN